MMPSELPVRNCTALESLQIAAAKLRLGLLQSRELAHLAMAALDEGHSGVSLGELAVERIPSLREHEGLFLEALQECGIQMPSAERAVEILLGHCVEMIATGAIQPYDGLEQMMSKLYHPYISDIPVARYVGDQRGLQHLIGAYHAYDDLRFRPEEVSFEDLYGDEALIALDQSVRRLAQAWLRDQIDVEGGTQIP